MARKIHFYRLSLLTGVLLLLVFMLLTGCATRKEVLQFQADHLEFRETLNNLESRMVTIETRLDTLHGLLGGNVQESFAAQEEILRSIRADSRSVSTELSTLINTLAARISDSDVHMRRLLTKLDEVNLLVTKLASVHDSTGMMMHFDVQDPERLYQQSYLDFTQGETDLARMGFSQYLELYSNTSLADNALYWIGETYMAEGKSDSARIIFEEFLQQYQRSNKLPTVLYKLGLVHAADGNRKRAENYFYRILDEFPDSSEAHMAQMRIDELDEIEDLPEMTTPDSTGSEPPNETDSETGSLDIREGDVLDINPADIDSLEKSGGE